MQGRTVLLTGGNSGIGQATAGQLGQRGARVIITARDQKRGDEAVRTIQERYGVDVGLLDLDLASFDSIRACAEAFRAQHDALHVLINNAGLNLSERAETCEGFEYVLGVNLVGHLLLTNLLLDRLKKGAPSRIVNLSSAAHFGARSGMTWDDLQRTRKYNGQAYCQAKLGMIYLTREQAHRYADDGISAFAVNPGFVTTRFGKDGDSKGLGSLFWKLGKYWMAKPDEGARASVVAACDDQVLAHSGAYIDRGRIGKPTTIAQDPKEARRLWDLAQQWIEQEHP